MVTRHFTPRSIVTATRSSSAQTSTSENGAQAVTPNDALIPPPQLLDDRVGFVNFFPDSIDGKIRAATYRVTDRQLAGLPPHPSEEVYESLSARALAKIGHAK